MLQRVRSAVCVAALACLAACKKTPPLEQRMGGSWRHSVDVDGLASKDPIVRGASKLLGAKPLRVYLEVGPGTLEVRRWSRVENKEVVQRATYSRLDGDRLELRSDAGTMVVGAKPGACDDAGACLELQLRPEGVPPLNVQESLGFLFGCDDPSGKIHCASLEETRTFYRYPKGADD